MAPFINVPLQATAIFFIFVSVAKCPGILQERYKVFIIIPSDYNLLLQPDIRSNFLIESGTIEMRKTIHAEQVGFNIPMHASPLSVQLRINNELMGLLSVPILSDN